LPQEDGGDGTNGDGVFLMENGTFSRWALKYLAAAHVDR